MNFQFDVDMDSLTATSDSVVEIRPSPMLVDPIYLSSDEEEMSSYTSGLVADDEEDLIDEIESMAVHVESAMFMTIPTLPTYAEAVVAPPSTPRRQLFTRESFNFDMGRGWVEKTRKNHPIELCKTVSPIPDTPLSPDTPNRNPDIFRPYDLPGPSREPVMQRDQMVNLVSGHWENITLAEPKAAKYSDCIICGRSYEQIVEETVQTYLQRTMEEGEATGSIELRKRAFLAGMEAGTFMFVPRGLSQAAACDGNMYTMNTGTTIGRALPGTLPLC